MLLHREVRILKYTCKYECYINFINKIPQLIMYIIKGLSPTINSSIMQCNMFQIDIVFHFTHLFIGSCSLVFSVSQRFFTEKRVN